jgi:acetate kinase
MNILIFNAGSASLKFEPIATPELPSVSDKQRKVVSGIVEKIGEGATFSLLRNKLPIQQEKIAASDYGEATRYVLRWLDIWICRTHAHPYLERMALDRPRTIKESLLQRTLVYALAFVDAI